MDPTLNQQTPVQTSGVPPAAPALAPAQPAPEIPASGQPSTPQATATPAKNPNSTQNTLLMSEIRDNMLIMNDGSFRAVVSCESINFDLMSGREREGVEFSYQSFLNSLYFPIQIFVRSQRVDIAPYLDKLVNIRRNQDNMLLGVLMEDYIGFIDAVARETNIMDKNFYVVVPYFPKGDLSALAAASKSIFTAFSKKPQETQRIKIDQAAYTKAKDELSNRINAVLSGLFQIGIKSKALNTSELSALYYNMYNPDTAIREPLTNPEMMTGTYIQKANEPLVPPAEDV